METDKIILIVFLAFLFILLIWYLYKSEKRKSKVIIELPDISEDQLEDLYITAIPDENMLTEMMAYEKKYFADCPIQEKTQVFIRKEICDKVMEVLPFIAPELGYVAYINNIVSIHLEENKNIIRILTENKFKKIAKSWKSISQS